MHSNCKEVITAESYEFGVIWVSQFHSCACRWHILHALRLPCMAHPPSVNSARYAASSKMGCGKIQLPDPAAHLHEQSASEHPRAAESTVIAQQISAQHASYVSKIPVWGKVGGANRQSPWASEASACRRRNFWRVCCGSCASNAACRASSSAILSINASCAPLPYRCT